MGFPGGPVVKYLPGNAGDVGLIPCLGHMLLGNQALVQQLLSPWSGALEPQLLNRCAVTTEASELYSPCFAAIEAMQREARAPQLESGPHLLQLEKSPRAAKKKKQKTAKTKIISNLKYCKNIC